MVNSATSRLRPLRVTSAVQVAVIASAATTMITPMMMLRIR